MDCPFGATVSIAITAVDKTSSVVQVTDNQEVTSALVVPTDFDRTVDIMTTIQSGVATVDAAPEWKQGDQLWLNLRMLGIPEADADAYADAALQQYYEELQADIYSDMMTVFN